MSSEGPFKKGSPFWIEQEMESGIRRAFVDLINIEWCISSAIW